MGVQIKESNMNYFDINSIKAEEANVAFENHEAMVEEYLTLLENRYCLQIGVSYGKDSSVVLNGATDAMRRAFDLGYIKADHPLVVVTVDTLLEPEPIQGYVPFAKRAVDDHCKTNNINLISSIVSPPIHHHLMILFAGAQKLAATASSGRSADCSQIWKIDTGIAELKRIKKSLPKEYQDSPWVSISGSRSDESTRRSHNMSKQGVRDLKANALIENIEELGESANGKVFKFAPISDWPTKDVISYLNHAGSDSMTKMPINKKIPAYTAHFGLLMAIYGEGSNDVCEITALDDENKADQKGCGKVARFGCVTCPLVGEDHSTIELKEYARWGRFGLSTLRFRDYIVRVSSDVKYRAFHARAYDPSSNNNVFLQPNTLKASVLEKMVWYASQITVDSREIHEEALAKYNAGLIDTDEGVLDIMSDKTLQPKVKKQYREMYIARLIEKPMFELFTERHAILLSLLWSLHGVASLPYRPVAILDSVKKGKRIPFPATNSEVNNKLAKLGRKKWDDKSELNNEVPDALVAKLFSAPKKNFTQLKNKHGDDLNEGHLQELLPFQLEDAWEGTGNAFTMIGTVDCATTHTASKIREFKLTYTINTINNTESIVAVDKATGRKINLDDNKPLHEDLIELGRDKYAELLNQTAVSEGVEVSELIEKRINQGGEWGVTCNSAFNNQYAFTSDVKFTENKLRKKQDARKNFSARKRTFDKATGKHTPGRASLKTYRSRIESALENQSEHTVNYWLPDFAVTRKSAIDIHDSQLINDNHATQSFAFDEDVHSAWLEMGGWNLLIQEHNRTLESLINERLPVRTFSGTKPVYHLTTNTGLSATSTFSDHMYRTLKRTEIFAKAKLYSLAPLAIDKIAKFPSVISMKEHRAQKAQHLLAVRYLKNSRRQAIKRKQEMYNCNQSNLIADSVSNVSVRINEFMEQYKQVATMHIASSAMAPFVDSAKLRTRKTEIWLNDFNKVIGSIDNALDVLATNQERKAINSDLDSKKVIASLHTDAVISASKVVSSLVKAPLDCVNTMQRAPKAEIKKIDGHYEAIGATKDAIEKLSNWIQGNYPRTNAFLIGHGLTLCLAYKNNLPYQSFMGTNEKDNSQERMVARSTKAMSDISSIKVALSLNLPIFSTLNSSERDLANQVECTVRNLDTAAKSNKLAGLMSANMDMILKLRA